MAEPVIRCILLDIEGTTCPVSFVASVLFPYARERLASYLDTNHGDPQVQELLAATQAALAVDPNPEVQALQQVSPIPANQEQLQPEQTNAPLVAYLQWLIDHDIKFPALKELQGRIWASGYACGDLVAPLFDDVAPALRRWHRDGYQLAVYSSGSVAAQQLLYRHSNNGNLEGLFSHWFDTRTGPKQQSASYGAIAKMLMLEPAQILFVSDAIAELEAANAVGMAVHFSDREGNPARAPGPFMAIKSLADIELP
ncbi:MAG: acireductone synthase [Synechococcales cyanobacterium SupBloom_Metag_052]|nr:acireductone synthase [Synechococcales cyanobacterium SupBloom_Metag_052]